MCTAAEGRTKRLCNKRYLKAAGIERRLGRFPSWRYLATEKAFHDVARKLARSVSTSAMPAPVIKMPRMMHAIAVAFIEPLHVVPTCEISHTA
jgi:hypothetical protein